MISINLYITKNHLIKLQIHTVFQRTPGSLGTFLRRCDVTSISLKRYFSNNCLLTVDQLYVWVWVCESVCVCVCMCVSLLVTLRCSSSLSCMNEYLAIDSGGYLCVNSPHALIAKWLECFVMFFQEKLRPCLIEQVCKEAKCWWLDRQICVQVVCVH